MLPLGTWAQTEREWCGARGVQNHKQTKQKKEIKPVGIVGLAQTVLEFSSNMHH